MATRARRHSAGSTLVEAVVILSLSLFVMTSGLRPLSLGVARLWLEHALYEALRCELSGAPQCRSEFERRALLVSWGRIQALELFTRLNKKMYKRASGEILWCNNRTSRPCHEDQILKIRMELHEKDLAGSPWSVSS